jgi:BirA family transcriptional regulator, biotin operon repressor / biotin---[acetyl-CoA-carboxylase] ligase
MRDLTGKLFLLDRVDSTNNYAMAQVQEGVAVHGDGWLAREQYQGKGRRGKSWNAEAGKNIFMSIALEPEYQLTKQFHISAMTAVAIHKSLSKYVMGLKIKWPNDIYWKDKKAGGILIENVVQGNRWLWSVVGIGINVNQDGFDQHLINPVSLKQITGKDLEIDALATVIRDTLVLEHSNLVDDGARSIMDYYNRELYKCGESVTLKKENARFETTIKCVDDDGILVVQDVMERRFQVDEVVWVV